MIYIGKVIDRREQRGRANSTVCVQFIVYWPGLNDEHERLDGNHGILENILASSRWTRRAGGAVHGLLNQTLLCSPKWVRPLKDVRQA